MATKRNFDELDFVEDKEGPASKKLKLSKENRGYARLHCGSMNVNLPKSLFEELHEHGQKSGYPLMYVFFMGSLLCSNFFGRPFLERLYTIDIWHSVWIPAGDADHSFVKYKRALLGLVGLFSYDEKMKIQMFLKSKKYYLQQFLDIIVGGTEQELFDLLKELKFGGKINVEIPIGVASLIAQFADGGGFLKKDFWEILLEPNAWTEYALTKFLTLMGLNQSTIMVFENDPIFMDITNMVFLNNKDFKLLLNNAKLDNLHQIKIFNNDLKIYNENGKESSDLPDNACEHKYCKPLKIDEEQEQWVIHWYQYLRYHAVPTYHIR